MNFETYKIISIGKCAFLKATASTVFFSSKCKNESFHERIIASLDFLAVAKCLLDDFDDFAKDLRNSKNNYGQTVLNEWLLDNGINNYFKDYNDRVKLFYLSKSAEKIIMLCLTYLDKATDVIERDILGLEIYKTYLDNLKNKANYLLIKINSYRLECKVQ
jgi:hypothetical protein